MTKENRIQFRLDERLANFLAPRRSHDEEPLGHTVRRLLNFYDALLTHGRQELAQAKFSREEAMLIMDACNGLFFRPETAHLVWAEVDEAIHFYGLDKKWGVDGNALVTKLRELSPAARFALVDLVMQFFAGEDATRDVNEHLRAIGFPVGELQEIKE